MSSTRTPEDAPQCSTCHTNRVLGDGEVCLQCQWRAKGLKCKKCGAPRVYILGHETVDGQLRLNAVPLCKPCCYSLIKAKGYFIPKEELDRIQTANMPEPEPEPEPEPPPAPPERRTRKKEQGDTDPGLFTAVDNV